MARFGFLDLGRHFADAGPRGRIAATVDLAQRAEAAGATRYWMAEHHTPVTAVSAPEVALAILSSHTSTIRLGAAGVLLQYYRPRKVAETYLTLAAAAGDRVDLGVCRGPGAPREVALSLVDDDEDELAPAEFDRKAAELARLLAGPADEPWPEPRAAPRPALWMLGSAGGSLATALEHGLEYGFMCFAVEDPAAAAELLEPHRESRGRGPLLALSVTCAATAEAAAEREASQRRAGNFPSNVVGDADSCADQIRAALERYGAGEAVLASFSERLADQRRLVDLIGRLSREAAAATPRR